MDDIIDFRSRFELGRGTVPSSTQEGQPGMEAEIVSLDARRFAVDTDNTELGFALDLARDVPLAAALQTAQERPDDRRALMVAAFCVIGALASLPRR
jgi:hypothetical protein